MRGHFLVLISWEISSRSRRKCLISCRLSHLSSLHWIGHSQVWDKNRGRDKRARFNNVSVDLIPWRAENTSTGVTTEVLLHKAYSQVDVLPQTVIFPTVVGCATKQVNFHGVSVSVPNSAACILVDRYLYSFGAFGVQFPCKWKCWVPCTLRISNGCWIQRLHFWCPVWPWLWWV